MLVIIASAKTQHLAPRPDLPHFQPLFPELTEALAEHCRQLSREEIAALMKVSPNLADSTWQRFQDFSLPHRADSAGPALATFAGDVFAEIAQRDYSRDDYLFAHERLRILSGLYGILRPLDLMQPYRLEMGHGIGVGGAADLYDYWSAAVTGQVNADLKRSGSSVVLNCASREYARVVRTASLDGTMIDLVFRQRRDGRTRTVAIHAKRARGMFVDWFVSGRIAEVDRIREFDRGGYRYVEGLSTTDEMVFVADL